MPGVVPGLVITSGPAAVPGRCRGCPALVEGRCSRQSGRPAVWFRRPPLPPGQLATVPRGQPCERPGDMGTRVAGQDPGAPPTGQASAPFSPCGGALREGRRYPQCVCVIAMARRVAAEPTSWLAPTTRTAL